MLASVCTKGCKLFSNWSFVIGFLKSCKHKLSNKKAPECVTEKRCTMTTCPTACIGRRKLSCKWTTLPPIVYSLNLARLVSSNDKRTVSLGFNGKCLDVNLHFQISLLLLKSGYCYLFKINLKKDTFWEIKDHIKLAAAKFSWKQDNPLVNHNNNNKTFISSLLRIFKPSSNCLHL